MIESSGSQSCTIGVWHTLAAPATAGTRVLVLDLSAMANGDTVEVAIWSRANTTSPLVKALGYSYSHAQAEPLQYSIPVTVGTSAVFVVKQTAGVSTTVKWAVENVDGDGGADWTPANLTGLVAWYDVSDASTVTVVSGKVSQLNDKSGNGRHLTQTDDAIRPTIGTRSMNGLNVLEFSGVERMDAGAFSVAQPYSVATTCIVDNQSTYRTVVSVIENSGYMPLVYSGSAKWTMATSTNLISTVSRTSYPTLTVCIANGASSNIRIDGVNTTGNAGTTAANRVILGSRNYGSSTFPMVGIIGEVVFVSGALSGADLASLESYLSAKWWTL